MLEIYRRGQTWWIRGSAEGADYIRASLGTRDEAVARALKAEIERKARQRRILGDDVPDSRDELTFAEAFMLYPAGPRQAGYIARVIPHIGDTRCAELTGQQIKDLARRLYPEASTDTWHRQVIVPVRAVVNHAADLGKAHPLRIRTFTRNERMAQDRARGKPSRQAKTAADRDWHEAFRTECLNPSAHSGRRRRKPNPYLAAIVWFMFTTGARVGQAIDIRRTRTDARDVDLAGRRVFLPAAKGHEAQWIEITTRTVVDLANLPPRHGRAFGYQTRMGVEKAMARVCADAGIARIMPHAAGRHGFFTEVLTRQGEDIKSAMQAGRAASARLVIETYTHADNAKRRIRNAFDNGETGTNPVQHENENGPKRA